MTTSPHTPDLDEAGLLKQVAVRLRQSGLLKDAKMADALDALRATTAGEPVGSPSDDLLAFCITETLGERCDVFDADCYTCQAWAQYDAHPSPDSDLLREALRTEEKYLHDCLNGECDLMHGDIEGAFHRLAAALSAAPAGGEVERLRDRLDKQMDYACDLQRIIEDLCHRREIREPQTAARHHYDMAVAYRAALNEGGSDDSK